MYQIKKLLKSAIHAFRKLTVSTRYYIVYYVGTADNRQITGQCSFSCYGFLNKKYLYKHLDRINAEGKDWVITGFNEINSFEYEWWLDNEC